MDGILSDPKKWNEAVQSSVQETFEVEETPMQTQVNQGLFDPFTSNVPQEPQMPQQKITPYTRTEV